MNQKVLLVIVAVAILGGYLIYQNKPINEAIVYDSIQKPQTVEEYCKSINTKYPIVQSVTDCRTYKIVNHGCCDIPATILDQNWDQIDSCGGFAGWSKECEEKYPKKDSCTTNSCKEVSQREFEKTYCTKDEDCAVISKCGITTCKYTAWNKEYLRPGDRTCTDTCPQKAKCISNKCTSIPSAH